MWRIQIVVWMALCSCLQLGRAQQLLRNSGTGKASTTIEEAITDDSLEVQLRPTSRRLKNEKDDGDGEQANEKEKQDGPVEGDPPFNGPPPAKKAPEQVSGDKKTVDNLLTNFQMAKSRLLQRMKNEYGGEEYFDTLFMDHEPAMKMPNGADTCTIGRNAFLKGSETSAKAWARTVRKMKLNLLEYLISGDVQDFVWATA